MSYQFLEPFTLKNGTRLKNRLAMAPMTTKSSFYNGALTHDEIAYYRMRTGGVGLVITGAMTVSELGKGFEGGASIASDAYLPQLKGLASAIKVNGTKAIVQLFHAGRKSTTAILRGEQPVSASAIAAEWPPNSETPRELSQTEIETIIEEFGEATHRAIEAGFDGVEIHGANTYLIQQFFSPHANRRTDKWGGSRQNRMQFALAILDKVQEVIQRSGKKEFIMGYRLSPEELENPGIRLEDSLFFASQIKERLDYLHLSIGSFNRSSLNNKEDKKPLLTYFKEAVGDTIPVMTVGTIKTPEDAQAAMTLGADFVALGRTLLSEPKWVQKVEANDLANLRLSLSPVDLEDLAIPAGMQDYLLTTYQEAIDFTTNDKQDSFNQQMAPMEGYKKQ